MSIYGVYCWVFAKDNENKALQVRYMSTSLWLKIIAVAALIFGIMLFVLWKVPDSPLPVMESLITALSIVATWLVAQKIVECWYIWFLADSLSVGVYVYQKLFPTAILFLCYSTLAIVGLIEWRKSVKQQIQ
jgi:nicotinamide mononucleotide transporter